MNTMLMSLATLGMAGQPGGGEGGQGNIFTSLMPLVVIFAIFYFLMIRPQQKQQKKQREMLAALKRGDKVVTRGGIYGTIFGLTEKVVTLEVDNNVKLRMSRDSITAVDTNTQES